jgi:hypothetical protein
LGIFRGAGRDADDQHRDASPLSLEKMAVGERPRIARIRILVRVLPSRP